LIKNTASSFTEGETRDSLSLETKKSKWHIHTLYTKFFIHKLCDKIGHILWITSDIYRIYRVSADLNFGHADLRCLKIHRQTQ